MSIITERFPMCDRCKEHYADYRQQPALTPKLLRAQMSAGGWRSVGRWDVCPGCLKKGKT